MNKKITLLNLLITGVIFNVNAGIIYTDINPDKTLNSTGSIIDINNDGTSELDTDDGSYFLLNNTEIWANGTAASGWDVPKPLAVNLSIGLSGNFITAGDISMDDWGGTTPFPLNTDAYLGVKFTVSGATYYGWIRVMWNGTNFLYKDYAYNNTANTPIKAGDKGGTTGINESVLANSLKVFPNPAKSSVNFINNSDRTINNIKIIDLLGKEQMVVEINEMETRINVSELKKGLYVIVAKTIDNVTVTKNIIIE